jgi:hypothetical protein
MTTPVERSQAEMRTVTLPPTITVRELGERLGISPIEVIKGLMRRGIMANINQAWNTKQLPPWPRS